VASAEPDGQAEGSELPERPERPAVAALDVMDPAQHRRPVGLRLGLPPGQVENLLPA